MISSVRENLAGLRARLDERRRFDPALSGLAEELFAVADVVAGDVHLRAALSDAGRPSQLRVATAVSLFQGRVSEAALDCVCDVVGQRWPDARSMVEALEGLGAQSVFLSAQMSGDLDEVEDQLYAVARTVAGSADLQMALTDPAVGAPEKASLIRTLLEGRAAGQTIDVVAYALSHLRGRRADSVLDALIDLAAEQRDRAVAEVRVARPLEPDQTTRLQAVLARMEGRQVHLNVAVEPSVIGGISVRIGDQVIDGTTASRIDQARRALVG